MRFTENGGLAVTLKMNAVLVAAALVALLSACSSSALTPQDALAKLQDSGYVCEDARVLDNELRCQGDRAEGWDMTFVGPDYEYDSLSAWVEAEWTCDADDGYSSMPVITGENWLVYSEWGWGNNLPYLTNQLGGKERTMLDLCP